MAWVPKEPMWAECWNDPWPDGYSSTGWGNAAVSLLKEFECNVYTHLIRKVICAYTGGKGLPLFEPLMYHFHGPCE